jgi:glyoxylase I family protein
MALARHFYCDVVGCTVDRELPQYGLLQLRAGSSLIDLVDIGTEEGAWARPPVEGGRNMDHLCLATSGFEPEAVKNHLAAHGVGIVEKACVTARRATDIPSISRTRSAIRSN